MGLDQVLSIASLVMSVIIILSQWGYRSDQRETKNTLQRHEERLNKNEDNLNDLKSELPFVYVMREDYVGALSNVERRITNVDDKLDRVLENIPKGGVTNG